MTPLTVVEALLDPTVNCFRAKVKRPGARNRTEGGSVCCQVRYFDFATSIVHDSRLIAAARVDEFNEPVSTGNERRMVSSARIVKFDGRTIQRRDRRMISRAVVKELYETGIEAPILRNWTAGSDSRCATTAVVKEIHVALDDGEGCIAGGARVEKIRYPEVGVDRCIAGAAPLEELDDPAASDSGIAS